jgi:hypothetical protein
MKKEEISFKIEDMEDLGKDSSSLDASSPKTPEIPIVTSSIIESEEESSKEVVEDKNFKKSWQDKVKGKTIHFLKNPWNLGFLVVLFLGIAIRLKYFNMESIWNDAAVHLWYAIKVTKEPLFIFSRNYLLGDHVVPQTITAFYYLFTKNAFIAGKLMALTYSVIGIIFMYLLGTEIKDRKFGLIASALFAFNHLFWFYGVRPLADAPLTVMVVLLLYSVVKLEKTKSLFWGITTGVIFLLSMATKQQAIVFLFAYLIYILIFKRKALFKKSTFISYGFPFGLIIFASIIFQNFFLSVAVLRIVNLIGVQDGLFYVYGHLLWIFGGKLLILACLGALFAIISNKKQFYFPMVLFLVYGLYLELGVNTVEDRIVMPLLSAGLLLVTFSLFEISSYISLLIKNKKIIIPIILVVVFFLSLQSYNLGNPLIQSKSTSYGGHMEIGKWIQDNVPKDAILFAGSPRIVRAFAEQEFGGPRLWDKGGNLWNLRAPEYLENQSLFEEDLNILSKSSEVYIEIDIWEYTQPSWYFPINQDSINYFINLGFVPIKIVERKVQTNQGIQEMPVIFLFKYNPNV